MLTNNQFDEFKQELNAIINVYRKEYSWQKPVEWKTYEKQWANRLRTALKELKTVISQAAAVIRVNPAPFGRPPTTSAKEKALLLLAKDLAQFSNRKMANLLPLFAALRRRSRQLQNHRTRLLQPHGEDDNTQHVHNSGREEGNKAS